MIYRMLETKTKNKQRKREREKKKREKRQKRKTKNKDRGEQELFLVRRRYVQLGVKHIFLLIGTGKSSCLGNGALCKTKIATMGID